VKKKRQARRRPARKQTAGKGANPAKASARSRASTAENSGALSAFLERTAAKFGPDSLTGAIVLVSLERWIDEFICCVEGLAHGHNGHSADWSHCFIIKRYAGTDTKIFEATINDPNTGGILWNSSLQEIHAIFDGPTSGIFENCLTSPLNGYDDPRVHPLGVKLMHKQFTLDERKKIVECAAGFVNQGYHYDVPGLFRELIRLTTGIVLPPGDKLLFCSAYVQAVFRTAFGSAGDFAGPTAQTADVTPDDLWFSDLGMQFLPKEV